MFILLVITYFLVSLASQATWSRLLQEVGAGATLLVTLRTSHARGRFQRLARLAVAVGFVLTLIGSLVAVWSHSSTWLSWVCSWLPRS